MAGGRLNECQDFNTQGKGAALLSKGPSPLSLTKMNTAECQTLKINELHLMCILRAIFCAVKSICNRRESGLGVTMAPIMPKGVLPHFHQLVEMKEQGWSTVREGGLADGGGGGEQGRGHGTGAVPKETVRKRRNYKARIPAPGLEYQIRHKRSCRERYPCGSQESKTLDGATEEK